eukprot:Plantae.Rhodophyta-Purpureofilum_apyrenoidigerum.ctg37793.p1 GENE.Plantae.Rhodophyta-Purpureofilum_apyrenoidigerum.ctg37793~~Plantae.Rhodophyta-Purpureofilum_apyrenoidigerum.ctg37793.p1  ORF type:complete len:163 (+),score=18.10 Plantae.Rhodophyta-Purpureofilum_apyrenoidigerum.ctg37793:131-619(+)
MRIFRRKHRDKPPEPPGPPGKGRQGAGFLAKFSYSWLDPLIWRGAKRQLNLEDLWDMPDEDGAGIRQNQFEKEYYKRFQKIKEDEKSSNATADQKTRKKARTSPSINRVLISVHRRKFLLATVFMFISQVYNLVAPTLIQQITRFVSDPTKPSWQGYLFVVS